MNAKYLNVFSLLILFSLYFNVTLFGQCYENLGELTGAPQEIFLSDLETNSCLLRDEFPVEFQNDFRVFDIGFYAHSESMYGHTDDLWQSAISEASSKSTYYLLIGRELNASGAYSKIRIDLVLPTTGVFECVNDNYLQVIKNTVESPVAYDKNWNSYPGNVFTGINNLRIYIKRIKTCCENGGTLESCGNCPINLNEASALLKSYGYSPIIGDVTISDKSYSNITSEYDINIDYRDASYSYTDHLEVIGSNDVQVRVKYYDENNCTDLMSFKELAYNEADYYEDIIILNFGNAPTILSKVRYNEQELFRQKKQMASKSKGAFIPWLVYQIVKRAAMASVGAVVDFGIQIGIERLVGGHDSWSATWDAINIDEGSLLFSALEGAFSDAKYVSFASSTLQPSVSYMLETPASDWEAIGFAQAFGAGAMQGAATLFLGRLMKHTDAAVERNGLIPVSKINQMVSELTPVLRTRPHWVLKLRSVVKAWKGLFPFQGLRTNTAWLERASKWIDDGLELVEDGAKVAIKKDGNKVGEIIDELLHVKYPHYGGDVVTHSSKTTTVLGKWQDPSGGGTGTIINSKLSKSGSNPGGVNALNETIPPGWSDQKIWDDVNKPWLESASSRRDVIRAVSDPNVPSNIYKPDGTLSFFGRENELLTKPVSQGGLGYTFDASTFSYVK